jgi:hypothetical protein
MFPYLLIFQILVPRRLKTEENTTRTKVGGGSETNSLKAPASKGLLDVRHNSEKLISLLLAVVIFLDFSNFCSLAPTRLRAGKDMTATMVEME